MGGRRGPDDEALAWEGEDGAVRRLTWAELDRAVRAAARRLSLAGVGEGTRVGILLPMLAETAIAVLALGRLRAVFSPIFSGYAAPAVAARLNAFEATHLITADGFLRRGATVELKAVADEAVALGADGPDGRGRPAARCRAAAGRDDGPAGTSTGRRTAARPGRLAAAEPSGGPGRTRSRRPIPRRRTW